jgi:hypothetical protein
VQTGSYSLQSGVMCEKKLLAAICVQKEPEVPQILLRGGIHKCQKGVRMSHQVKMTLREIDSAIARNLMKWHRSTREVAQSSIWTMDGDNPSTQALDPHWFDKEGRPVALAEAAADSRSTGKPWSPTRNLADAQQVRTKLAEKFQFILLGRLAVGALFIFAMVIDRPLDGKLLSPYVALGPSEEIATGLCALATVQINAEIQED